MTSVPPNVLTLEETADYLRLPPEVVAEQASEGKIPGQYINHTWRFLKLAIDDWLRASDQRTRLLNQAGALADDETLATLQEHIDHARQTLKFDVSDR